MALITITDAELLTPGFLDEENPRSIVNIVPDRLRDFIVKINPNTLLMSPTKLKDECRPDFTAKCLKINFWNEYVRAQDKSQKMKLGNIIKGVCQKEYFFHFAEHDPTLLAWVILPPEDFNLVQEEIYQESLEQMRSILLLEPFDEKRIERENKDGTITVTIEKKVNSSLLSEKRKIMEVMGNRIQGSITQKVHMTGNVSPVAASGTEGILDPNALENIEKSLALVEGRLGSPPDVIDAEIDSEVNSFGRKY